MTSEASDSKAAVAYGLECNDCSFETTVQGDFLEALDVADDHQEEYDGQPIDHFVNIEQNGHE